LLAKKKKHASYSNCHDRRGRKEFSRVLHGGKGKEGKVVALIPKRKAACRKRREGGQARLAPMKKKNSHVLVERKSMKQ